MGGSNSQTYQKAWATMSALYCILLDSCPHNTEKSRTFSQFNGSSTFEDVLNKHHPAGRKNVTVQVAPSETGPWSKMELDISLVTASSLFGLKYIHICCTEPKEPPGRSPSAKSAFDLLMQRDRGVPNPKTHSSGVKDGISKKDELYNDLTQLFQELGWTFPNDSVNTEGTYFIQVLCNALWYVTNQHQVIYDASTKQPNVTPIPSVFDKFQGYNNIKRKRQKEQPMTANTLASHADALYSLCLRPITKSGQAWENACRQIHLLADCLKEYKTYLDEGAKIQSKIRKMSCPVRQVESGLSVEERVKSFVPLKKEYELLEKDVQAAGPGQPIFFDEHKHLETPFSSNMQRKRFLDNLKLTTPIFMFRYAPGGAYTTVVFIVQVKENMTDEEKLQLTSQLTLKVRPKLPEFHTYQMKKQFKEKLKNIAFVSPAVCDFIYKELALDDSACKNPSVQQRIRLTFLGDTGLLPDLRTANEGRPKGAFETFFNKMSEVIEKVTAADERRHNVAHMSEWLSMKDLIQQTIAECPEDTPVPSRSLVRLQFAPKNPYLHSSLNFTSKLEVQYKIQRRQLRTVHQDDHYCAAILKYMKGLAILFKDHCTFISADDKAKVPLGDPDCPISTGVRGKKSIAPSSTTLASLDHDLQHRGSLTPAVYLNVDIPEKEDKSFCRGTVTTVINDSVFQPSSPFRHAAVMRREMSKFQNLPILLKYSDGGTDQRNNLEHVKCSLVSLFKVLNLDMLIAARCAPGQSWTNPAERIMSILNLGLQNTALCRDVCEQPIEKILSKCNSMDAIRKVASSNDEIPEAWQASIKNCQEIIQSRFTRLTLKEKPIQVETPVSGEEIQEMQKVVTDLFPGLDTGKLTKQYTSKNEAYKQWMRTHAREHHYIFQIRKCDDTECCGETTLPREKLIWLPDPILDESGLHYKDFKELYGSDTSEVDRPSFAAPNKTSNSKSRQPCAMKSNKNQPPSLKCDQEPEADAFMFTAQNAQAVVECVECRKPRLIYAKNRLTERQKVTLTCLISEYDFSCGTPLTYPGHSLHGKVFSRLTLQCQDKVENPYYSSDIGRKDTCAHCGCTGGIVEKELLQKFKTVHPICNTCMTAGYEPVCMRPYGKQQHGKKK